MTSRRQDVSVGVEQQCGGIYGTGLLAGSNDEGRFRDTTGQACPLASASASSADARIAGVNHGGVGVRTRARESSACCSGKLLYVLPRLPSWRVYNEWTPTTTSNRWHARTARSANS